MTEYRQVLPSGAIILYLWTEVGWMPVSVEVS